MMLVCSVCSICIWVGLAWYPALACRRPMNYVARAGFYIHSCQKMRYKGDYAPSYLADPEEYTWFPLEKCRPLLDQNHCASFAHPEHSLREPSSAPSTSHVLYHGLLGSIGSRSRSRDTGRRARACTLCPWDQRSGHTGCTSNGKSLNYILI